MARPAGVAGLVVEELRERSEQISSAHEAIFARLQQPSSSAEEVVQMKLYLSECETEQA